VGGEEGVDEEGVDRVRIDGDPPIAILLRLVGRAPLEPVQRALAGQRMTTILLAPPLGAGRVRLAHHRRQQGVPAQLVVVDEVLVAERQGKDPLPDEMVDRVLAALRIAMVDEAGGEAVEQLRRPIRLLEQHSPAVRRDLTTIEARHQPAPLRKALQLELRSSTLCRQGLPPFVGRK
jgi:hypothetical protein